jgi:phosphoglycolate phosphatase-like HAD superfamily hydrolase
MAELAALADGSLPAERRAVLEADVASSAELAALLAEQRLTPDQALFVGDTSEDRDAALAAGVRFAGVAYGYGREGLEAAAVALVREPAEIVALVED